MFSLGVCHDLCCLSFCPYCRFRALAQGTGSPLWPPLCPPPSPLSALCVFPAPFYALMADVYPINSAQHCLGVTNFLELAPECT